MLFGCVSGHMGYNIGIRGVTPIKIIPVYIDEEFCIKDRVEIVKAINEWNTSLNGYIELRVWDGVYLMNEVMDRARWGDVYVIIKVYSRMPIIAERDAKIEGEVTIGLANKVGGNWLYLVRDRLGDDDIKYVTMHELGHLLGADHQSRYLMGSRYNKIEYKCIDQNTLDQVSSYWRLPLNNLSYCYQ